MSEKKGGRHDELSFWGTRESETLLHLGVSGVVPRRTAYLGGARASSAGRATPLRRNDAARLL